MDEVNFLGINFSCDTRRVRCFRCGLRGIFAELKKMGYGVLRKAGIMMMPSFDTVIVILLLCTL